MPMHSCVNSKWCYTTRHLTTESTRTLPVKLREAYKSVSMYKISIYMSTTAVSSRYRNPYLVNVPYMLHCMLSGYHP